MKLLLDMDGVIVNFISAICKIHNQPNPYEDSRNLGNYSLDKIWGITRQEFLEPTNSIDWWRELDRMPDFDPLMELLYKYFSPKDICILSCPSKYLPLAYTGKAMWCHENIPQIKNILIGTNKQFCACRDNLLLDDDDFKIDQFRMAGGRAVLVPRPWNSGFDHAGELSVISDAFESMFLVPVTHYE